MFCSLLISSLAACPVHAVRFETDPGRFDHLPHKPVDCSHLKPPPKWEKHEVEWKQGPASDGFFYVTNVPLNECEDYFVYLNSPQRFVAMQKVGAGDTAFCAAGDFQGNANYCNNQKLDILVDYSKEWVPEQCKERLCDWAKTGRWRDDELWKDGMFSVRRSWRKWRGKSMPWPAQVDDGTKSSGYEDVYDRCWKGPDETYKLPSLKGLDEKYQLINHKTKTFNKLVCGCPTADKC
eukprot:Skav204473  [mRNA]  locus=scaffold5533:115618:116325:- [translate_table: standard]